MSCMPSSPRHPQIEECHRGTLAIERGQRTDPVGDVFDLGPGEIRGREMISSDPRKSSWSSATRMRTGSPSCLARGRQLAPKRFDARRRSAGRSWRALEDHVVELGAARGQRSATGAYRPCAAGSVPSGPPRRAARRSASRTQGSRASRRPPGGVGAKGANSLAKAISGALCTPVCRRSADRVAASSRQIIARPRSARCAASGCASEL